MEYRILGRTGLRASVMGLGCGGHSRLGLSTGNSEDEAARVVQRALELGINLIDTAEVYGTEAVVGRALRSARREDVILCTKKLPSADGVPLDAAGLRAGVERSLRLLGTDYVDIFYLHAVAPGEYERVVRDLLPVLQELKREGKIRFIGLTEGFSTDPGHEMLGRALRDGFWDAVMAGFNIINQSARARVLPAAGAVGSAFVNMFAVRRALSRTDLLAELLLDLKKRGLVEPEALPAADPLGFLMHPGGAESLVDAAYRFCRDEPGIHVVLSGTGNVTHLEANHASFQRPPLPAADRARLAEIFARVDCVSGN